MKNGTYHVVLRSSEKSVDATAVVSDDAIDGGGSGYLFQGRLWERDNVLSGTVLIKKWDRDAPPVLGLFKEVSMDFEGEYDREKRSFHLYGRFHGHHVIEIRADGKWVSPGAMKMTPKTC